MRLYLVRWPDGAATVLGADSLEHAVELIDDVDQPNECEVVPLDRLWLTMRPSVDLAEGPLTLCHRPSVEIDSQHEILSAAFPVLSRVVEGAQREADDGDIIEEDIELGEWREASSIEANRILAPSPEFKKVLARRLDALSARAETDD